MVVRFFTDMAAMGVPGVVRVGSMRVSMFGICAAVGLVAAFAMMPKMAAMAGVERERAVDAGMFGVTAAFVVSRVWLVVENWRVFQIYPVLVLSLPALGYGAMGLTAVAVAVYVGMKKLPVLRLLDAWAPCAAVLAAALSVGHWFEGSDAGMPTRMPWGVSSSLGKVHPVQMYALVLALVLLVVMVRELRMEHVPGQVLRLALIAGGAVVFLLRFVTQPEPNAVAGLEAGQWVALGAVAAGWGLSARWSWMTPSRDFGGEKIEKELS